MNAYQRYMRQLQASPEFAALTHSTNPVRSSLIEELIVAGLTAAFENWYRVRGFARWSVSANGWPGERAAWALALKAGFFSVRYAMEKDKLEAFLTLAATSLPYVTDLDSCPQMQLQLQKLNYLSGLGKRLEQNAQPPTDNDARQAAFQKIFELIARYNKEHQAPIEQLKEARKEDIRGRLATALADELEEVAQLLATGRLADHVKNILAVTEHESARLQLQLLLTLFVEAGFPSLAVDYANTINRLGAFYSDKFGQFVISPGEAESTAVRFTERLEVKRRLLLS